MSKSENKILGEEKKVHLQGHGLQFYNSPEHQEITRLKEALSRTPEERFYFMTSLMKMQAIFKRGVLRHKTF